MSISDAFTHEAIQAAGTDVSGEEEHELREMIRQIYVNNEMEHTDDHENVAVLTFVAGRTNQKISGGIQVYMTSELANEFMQFLVDKKGAS